MNTPINKEATYMQGRPTPVVFRKVTRPDVTITIIGDFVNREIADLHAPKEGKIGEAYVSENLVFLWDIQRGVWVAEGIVGDIWEPVPYQPFDTFNAPTLSEEAMLKASPNASKEASNLMGGHIYIWNSTGGVYENIGKASDLLGSNYAPEWPKTLSFTMKGNWEDGKPLPEEGAEPGDCYIWENHCWARTSLHEWKDYGDLTHMASVQFEFLNDCNNQPIPTSGAAGVDDLLRISKQPLFFLDSDGRDTTATLLQNLYQEDCKAGYNGTMNEWRSQNGDLNSLLRKAAGVCKDPVGAAGVDIIFKSDTIQPPPRPGSVAALEEQRVRIHQRELLVDSKEHPSLDDVASLLEGALTKLEGEESDAAFKALDALKKVKVDLRRKRRNTWLRWMLFWAILGGVVYGLYKWIPTQVVSGRYTVTKICSVPFGNGTITGMRYYDYGYKSLFGVHMTLESTVRENTDVTRNGQEFTIFGLSPRNEAATEEEMALADKVLKTAEVEVETEPKPPKGKWWRINIWTSDKGSHWMKPAELYLFASEKFTTMVAYKDFCK